MTAVRRYPNGQWMSEAEWLRHILDGLRAL
jgi:hypothetical protein